METLFGVSSTAIIEAAGLIGVFAIVFAESGLFIGFMLPGDSLLFTAGFLASQKYFSIIALMTGCFVAAVLGDNIGYGFGKRVGPKIFTRENSLLFRKSHLERARVFYEIHGGKTIILARFIPFIRTFAPILAGVGRMDYRTFFFYNMAGGLFWAVGLTGLGYVFGSTIPHVDRYIHLIVVCIVVLSVSPPLIHIMRDPEHRREIKNIITKIIPKC